MPRSLGVGPLLALPAIALVIDAVLRTPGALDLQVLRAIQGITLPGIAAVLWPVDRLTSAAGAVIAWSLILLTLLLARSWLPALAVLCLPAAGVVDNIFRLFLVARERPAADQVIRTASGTDQNAFPSGHVLGAVLLYGLLFVLAERLHPPLLRLGVRLLCGWVIATVGVGRLWYGAHWPTDVLGGYAMGGVLLASLVQVFRWTEQAGGVLGALRHLRRGAGGWMLPASRPYGRHPDRRVEAGAPAAVTVRAPAVRPSPAPFNRGRCSCCGGRRCRGRTWP